MIDLNVVIDEHMQRVIDALEKSSFVNLGHAAERIVVRAKRSIRPATTTVLDFKRGRAYVIHEHSQPGQPPFTSLLPGHNLRDAIKSSWLNHTPGTLDNISIVIGTDKSEIGNIGEVMERGGEYKGAYYEPRPFIWPAFQAELDSVAPEWAGAA